MKRMKKALSWLLSLAMIVGLLPAITLPVKADDAVPYQDVSVDPVTHAVTYTEKTIDTYTVVTDDLTACTDGWYVVNSNPQLVAPLTISGDVKLIICDDYNLLSWNYEHGNDAYIQIADGASLTVYGQSEGNGGLQIDCERKGPAVMLGAGSSFTVNGARLSVNCSHDCSIDCVNGSFTVNGGRVIVRNDCGANDEVQPTIRGNVIVNGGYLEVVNNYTSDGSGMPAILGNLTVNGGTVKPDAYRDCLIRGTVTMNGGSVEAYGGNNHNVIDGDVVVTGGELKAVADGTGYAVSGTLTQTGGVVEAGGYPKAISGTVQSPFSGFSTVVNYETYEETKTIFPAPEEAKLLDYTSIQIPGLYNLWVGETAITTDNYASFDESGKASYNPDTNTLTLNGFTYDGPGHTGKGNGGASLMAGGGMLKAGGGNDYAAAIFYGGFKPLTIVLRGENRVRASAAASNNCGIYSDGSLSFTGSGSLTAVGGDLAKWASFGICAQGYRAEVAFSNGCKVTALGRETISADDKNTFGITGSVVLNDATVEARGHNHGVSGNATVNEGTLRAAGGMFTQYYAQAVAGTLTVAEGGTVKAGNDGFDSVADVASYAEEKFVVASLTPSPQGTVKLSEKNVTIVGGESTALQVTVKSYDTAEKTVTWSVPASQQSIVALYSDEACTTPLNKTIPSGTTVYVKGGNPGSAAVTFTNADDAAFQTACAITVLDPKLVVTVNKGTDSNSYVPIYGYYADSYLNCQYIIPADDLATSKGNTLQKLRFYTADPAKEAWTGTFNVYVGPYAGDTISAFQDVATQTLVYTGKLDGTGETMDIPFSADYVYTEGNLLVTVQQVEKGNYPRVSWYGVSREGASVQGYDSGSIDNISAGQKNFAPKTTLYFAPSHVHDFSYSADGAVITAVCREEGCPLPENTATLTIGAPTGDDGAALLTAEPGDAFDMAQMQSAVEYSKTKSGDAWTDFRSAPFTEDGFYSARITLPNGADSVKASVVYGMNCLSYTSGQHGTVSGASGATVGADIVPVIRPDKGYELDTLSAKIENAETGLTVTDNERFVMPEANVVVSATFKLKTYTITDTSTHGTVSASGTLQMGQTITLTPHPATGYAFQSLTVKDAEKNTVPVTDNTFTMPASDVTVTATFQTIDYSITVNEAANGTVSADRALANYGDTVTLTLTPATGYEVDTVTVTDGTNNVTVTDNQFTMPAANVTVTAAFKKSNYTVTVNETTNGTVGADKTTAQMGDAVTLTVTPANGYEVDTLTVTDGTNNVTVTDNKFTMPAANVTVTAAFKKSNYTVTVSETTNGTVGADKTTAQMDDTVTLTVTPAAGYEVDTLTVTDGKNNVTVTDNQFTMPAANVTVTAAFKKSNYTVTVGETEHGTVRADKATAQMGDTVTLTIAPEQGYVLDAVQYNGTRIEMTDGAYTFAMPAENVTVTAAFVKRATYTVFYRAEGDPASVLLRLKESDQGTPMLKSTKLGSGFSCWEIQVEAKEGMTALPIAFSTDGGATWSALADRAVVADISSNLPQGSAQVLRGEADVFLVTFVWGEIEDGEYREFLATGTTESITIADPEKTGYNFMGWDDGVSENLKTAVGGKVDISNLTETTILAARWTVKTATVTFDLNGGSGSAPAVTLAYGETVSAPANPTKEGYAFVRWVVAKNSTQKIGGRDSFLSAGTAFNFAGTAITGDLMLRAQWKHVHSYVCLPLDHPMFDGAFSEYVDAGYGDYLHIKLCTDVDDYDVESHAYDSNGKCACGAVRGLTMVTLTKTIDGEATTTQVARNSVVSLAAPQSKNGKQFTRWQYFDGSNWRNLSTSTCTAFVIPATMQVRAVYEGSYAELNVESFDYKGNIAFYFSYKVPTGYTVVDGGILTGNNSHLRYMLAKTPEDGYDLSVSGMVQYFVDIPGPTAPVTYEVAKNSAVDQFGAAKIAKKMYMEEAVNVSGSSNPIFKRVSSLGRAGTAAIAVNSSANNIYYYGMGYVICKAPNGSYVVFSTDAIAATGGNPNHSTTAKINVQ